MQKIGAVVGLLIVSLLAAGFAVLTPAEPTTDRFQEKANLALRRTVDHLLRAAGDSVSLIPPVEESGRNTFRIRINRNFDYNRLPALLQESLHRHGIREAYDVAVLDCAKGVLQLGYTVEDLDGTEPVPCGGRSQAQGCFQLQVAFARTEAAPGGPVVWWALAAFSLLGAGVYAVRNRSKAGNPTAAHESGTDDVTPAGFRFDNASQTLFVGDAQHQLTHREAKLLRFFLDHPNQVLEREAILKAVWEDEGVTVGRSVDVFVSRLRKLLQADPRVQIRAVHGVGYRLDRKPE